MPEPFWKSGAEQAMLEAVAHDYPREDGEAIMHYLERLNVEAGIIPIEQDSLSTENWERFKERPTAVKSKPKPKPPLPPPAPEWSPYKEADDDLEDLVPKQEPPAHEEEQEPPDEGGREPPEEEPAEEAEQHPLARNGDEPARSRGRWEDEEPFI